MYFCPGGGKQSYKASAENLISDKPTTLMVEIEKSVDCDS